MVNFLPVTSRDNPLVKTVTKLQSSARFRKEQGLFVAEGLRILEDCADNGVSFDTLVVSVTFLEKFASKAESLAQNSAKNVVVPNGVFQKMADTNSPQGILAIVKIPKVNSAVINSRGRYIALENVSDPSNLGAVSRTAEALGVSGIILSSAGCDPFSPKALRASMGTLLRVPVIVLDDFVAELSNTGLNLFACVVSGGESITNVSFRDGCAVLIGNEANGLTQAAVSISKPVTIPMSGRAESLNAAVAASIAIWEMKKS